MLALFLAFALQDSADSLVESATAKLLKNDFAGAIEGFTKALALDPRRSDAWLGRGKGRSKTGDVEGALRDLDEAAKLDPKSPEPLFWRGVAHETGKAWAAAIADFTRAIKLGGTAPAVYLRRATCLMQIDRYDEAAADLDRVIDRGLRTFEPYALRTNARFHRMEFAGAISDATRALERAPDHPGTLYLRALSYHAANSPDNALGDFRRFVERAGGDELDALLLWIIRSRAGRVEEATKEYVESKKADPAAVAFLEGRTPEENYLAARGSFQALHFAGQRRLLSGDAAGARDLFDRASKAGRRDTVATVLARAEVESLDRKERLAVLEALEEKFRSLGPFRAEIKTEGFEDSEAMSINRIVLHADLKGDRLSMHLLGMQGGKNEEAHMLVDRGKLFRWGTQGKALMVDMTAFMERARKGDAFENEWSRIVPPDPKEEPSPPPGPTLDLTLDPKPAADMEGGFRFRFGYASRPASWLRELRTLTPVRREEHDGALTFELSSRKKVMVIDLKTGFLRSLQTTDYDGKMRRLTIESFKEEPFPDSKPPGKFESVPVDLSQLMAKWTEQQGWVAELLRRAIERWDEVVRLGKDKDVNAALTRWAGGYLHSMHLYAAHSIARQYIKAELDRGTPLAELERRIAEETKRFREAFEKSRKDVEAFERERLGDLSYRMETDAIESAIDSRRHPLLKKLLTESFDFDTVEKERRASHGDPLDKVFKEELEANRQL